MTKKIEELQIDIGVNLDAMLPTEYDTAWIFYELDSGVMPSYWFCYIDSSAKKVIPFDCIEDRKNIIVKDKKALYKHIDNTINDIQQLQKEYIAEFGKCRYGITYQLNGDGTFNVSFSYEKPTGGLQARREKWCMEHLGTMPPKITKDMLRS